MNRLEAFETLKTHPMIKKRFKILDKDDINFMTHFINDNNEADKNEFEYILNRAFLDLENKPKQWTSLSEILSCTNSLAGRTKE